MNIVDLTGQEIGNLIVVEAYKSDYYGIHWKCLCKCGNTTIVRGGHLRQGKTRSCGCQQGNHFHPIKHGHAMGKDKKASPEYYTWLAMMARCKNPNTKRYMLYGGRGISVCDRWLVFDNFLSDMGLRTSDKHSLDRFPNKDGNYEPGNCRWATIHEQNRNTSRNIFIEYDGRNQILEEWATELNTCPSAISNRIKNGQPFSEVYMHYKNSKKRKRKAKIFINE